MTGDHAHPAVKPSAGKGAIAQEIAHWLSSIRSAWTQSREMPLGYPLQLFIASMGCMTWLFGTWFTWRRLEVPPLNLSSIPLNVLILISIGFGALIARQDRKCGPVRLFLDGLLVPAATVAIIGMSSIWIGRTQDAQEQPTPTPSTTTSQGVLLGGEEANDEEPD